MSEKPFRILQLSELQSVASRNSALRWGIDPRGPIPITNPDGSIVWMPAKQGFSFVENVASPSPFFICYEFYGGIAMHTERDERALAAADSFAQHLGAKLFLI